MPVSTTPTKVLLISEPGPTQQQVTNTLSSQSEFKLVDVISTPQDQTREIRGINPDLILIDHEISDQPILDVIDELVLQFPEIAIIAILPTNDPLMAQQVMLAGARGFIAHPFTQVNLLSTIRRIRELEKRRQKAQADTVSTLPVQERPIRTIAVYSPRGGTGCSTVAANLAISLHNETKQRVLLMEGKLYFGHLGLMLNIHTDNTLADLIPHASQMDESLIQDVITEHASGIDVLLGPFDVQIAQGIRPQDIYNILVGLQGVYDYVVIDAGSSMSENAVTILDAADRILLVSTPDLASLHDTRRFVELSRSVLVYRPEKLLFVLNRNGMPGGVQDQDITSALHEDLFVEIPDIGPNALWSINRGVPLVINYPRSPASRAIHRMANKIRNITSTKPAKASGGQTAFSREEIGSLASSSTD